MKIFVATSYASQVNYKTGKVSPVYQEWLEKNLTLLESWHHTVFCALRADLYRINNTYPGDAYKLDIKQVNLSDMLLALLDEKISAGVQTEIGYALALNKKVVLAHSPNIELSWFNRAILQAGQARELVLPLTSDSFGTT